MHVNKSNRTEVEKMKRPYPAFSIFSLILIFSTCLSLLFGYVILENKNKVTNITRYLTSNSIPSSLSDLKISILLSGLRQEFERSMFATSRSLQNESAYNANKIHRAISASDDEKAKKLVSDAIELIEHKDKINQEIAKSQWSILDSVIEKYNAEILANSFDEITEKLTEIESATQKDTLIFQAFTGLLITLQAITLILIFSLFVRPLTRIEKSIHNNHQPNEEDGYPSNTINSKINELYSLESAIKKLHLTTRENINMQEKITMEMENAKNSAEEKAEFLSSMSHEINTPLSSIIIVIYLLEQTRLDETQKSYIDRLTRSANYLSTLIERVLKMSRMDANRLELEITPLDIAEIVQEVYSILEPISSKKQIRFRTQIDNSLPPILMGDRLNIKEILLNFASNAIKFTSTGEVRIEVRAESKDEDKVNIILAVIDTGRGIAATDIPLLYQRFSQIKKKAFAGTGLGLAITKGLTELMGGNVGVESKEGTGSTFFAKIPLRLPETVNLETTHQKRVTNFNLNEASNQSANFIDRKTQELLAKIYFMAKNDSPDAVTAWLHNEDEIIMCIGSDNQDIGEKIKKFKLQDAAIRIAPLLGDSTTPVEVSTVIDTRKPVILIIDDTPENLDLFNLLLNDIATVKVTPIPERGIEIAKSTNEISLIILDIAMPIKDGYEVIKELKSDPTSSHIPVVMISASESHDTRMRCLKAGAAEFIDRNKTPDKIEAIVQKYVDKCI